MQLLSKQVAYWLQQTKANIISPSLVILPPPVTHSAHKWANPPLLHLIVLFSPAWSANILINWLNGLIFPLWVSMALCHFHLLPRVPPEDISTPVLCQGVLIVDNATGQAVTRFLRAGYTLPPSLPIPLEFFASPYSCFSWCRVSSASVSLYPLCCSVPTPDSPETLCHYLQTWHPGHWSSLRSSNWV